MSGVTENISGFTEAEAVCLSVHGEDQPFAIKLKKAGSASAGQQQVWFECGTFAEHARKFPLWRKSGVEPFMVLGITDGAGYALQNITHTWAVAADLDRDTDIAYWERLTCKPTFAVNTSGSRFHLVWVLSQAIHAHEAKKVLPALALRLDADRCFANLTQAVRLPGFTNSKTGELSLLAIPPNADRSYDISRIEWAFDVGLCVEHFRSRYRNFDNGLTLPKATVSKCELLEDVRSALGYISPDSYDMWYRVGMALQSLGDDGRQLWIAWSKKSEKFSSAEAEAKWGRLTGGNQISLATVFYLAAEAGWSNPGFQKSEGGHSSEPLTERQVGRRLAAIMEREYAVLASIGKSRDTYTFMKWDGFKYQTLSSRERREQVEQVVAKVKTEATTGKELSQFLTLKSKNNQALDDLGDHIGEFLVESSTARDASGYPYFPVENGVLNLLSGELVPASFRPVAQFNGGVTFDPTADAPLFLKTIAEIFENDKEMIKFVLRLMGYIMLGKPSLHVFPVFFGPKGRNGKTLLVEVFKAILGPLATAIPVTAIMTKSHVSDGPTPAIAQLQGKRLAILSEPNGKHELDSGFIKLMTGGESITARQLHGHMVEFLPEFVPLMITNVMPRTREDDHALWRRMIFVHFNRTFSDQEIDVDLKEKLLRESSGILNRLLLGVQDYLANGLGIPEKVKAAGDEQRTAVSIFEAWHQECARVVEKRQDTALQALWSSFDSFAKENPNFSGLNKRQFSRKLEERGYEKIDRRNLPHFSGISLASIPPSLGT